MLEHMGPAPDFLDTEGNAFFLALKGPAMPTISRLADFNLQLTAYALATGVVFLDEAAPTQEQP